MSFRGCQFTSQLHEYILLRDWWDVQGCQHCGALTLAGGFQVSPRAKWSNLYCLPVFFFFLWRIIGQNFFHEKVSLFSVPGMDQALPAACHFPQAMSSSALHLELQILCFLFASKGQNEKRIFACLDSGSQLVTHRESKKELKSMFKER